MSFELKSTAFDNGRYIPKRFSGEGEDTSPPLEWTGVPSGVKSFALICDDPDAPAGVWVHWVVFNIPSDKTFLPESFPSDAELPDGTRQGVTDFGRTGYGGPMPPPGKAHRYFFKLYALDTVLDISSGIRKSELLSAMDGHILAECELVGLYER